MKEERRREIRLQREKGPSCEAKSTPAAPPPPHQVRSAVKVSMHKKHWLLDRKKMYHG